MAEIIKKANAEWTGDLKTGNGRVSTESGNLDSEYGFNIRFEGAKGTNPEELLGAAHSSCFTMAFANKLSQAGFIPDSIKTEDKVYLEKVDGNFKITKIEINTEASVPKIEESKFQEIAKDAKENCPLGQALKAVDMVLNAKLK